ncbi:MAG: CHAT domain-containing protein, partial [Acidobacteriota bacterium]
ELLHFASHAITHSGNGGQSMLVMKSLDETDNALLTSADIARLPLNGQIIVLSACSAADGRLLHGEGLQSLAQAFFRAGARTVVASQWPLEDSEAHHFFEQFYASLRTGATVGEAVTRVQRLWLAAGLPSEAWAGVIVMGDGDARLSRVSPSQQHRVVYGLWCLAAAILAGAYGPLRKKRK